MTSPLRACTRAALSSEANSRLPHPSLWWLGRARSRPAPSTGVSCEGHFASPFAKPEPADNVSAGRQGLREPEPADNVSAGRQGLRKPEPADNDFSSVTIVVGSPKPFPWPPPVIMTNLPSDDLGACKCSRHCNSRHFLADVWLWLQCRRRAARRASRKVTLKNLLTGCAAGSKPFSKLPFVGWVLANLTIPAVPVDMWALSACPCSPVATRRLADSVRLQGQRASGRRSAAQNQWCLTNRPPVLQWEQHLSRCSKEGEQPCSQLRFMRKRSSTYPECTKTKCTSKSSQRQVRSELAPERR